jgi:hypothetical protein
MLNHLETNDLTLFYVDKPVTNIKNENIEVMLYCKEYIAVKTDVFRSLMKDLIND